MINQRRWISTYKLGTNCSVDNKNNWTQIWNLQRNKPGENKLKLSCSFIR